MRTLKEIVAHAKASMIGAEDFIREVHALGRSEMEAEVERLRAEAVRDSKVIAAGWTKREALEAEIASLRAEVARLTEEVRRYTGPAVGNEPVCERDVLLAQYDEARALADRMAKAIHLMLRWKPDDLHGGLASDMAFALTALRAWEEARRGSEGGGR